MSALAIDCPHGDVWYRCRPCTATYVREWNRRRNLAQPRGARGERLIEFIRRAGPRGVLVTDVIRHLRDPYLGDEQTRASVYAHVSWLIRVKRLPIERRYVRYKNGPVRYVWAGD